MSFSKQTCIISVSPTKCHSTSIRIDLRRFGVLLACRLCCSFSSCPRSVHASSATLPLSRSYHLSLIMVTVQSHHFLASKRVTNSNWTNSIPVHFNYGWTYVVFYKNNRWVVKLFLNSIYGYLLWNFIWLWFRSKPIFL